MTQLTAYRRSVLLALILLAALAAKAEPVRVMSLGDSITAQYAQKNYRLPLGLLARSVGCDLSFVGVYNDGHTQLTSQHSAYWGIRADTVDQYWVTPWTQQVKPDVVLMHLGTNDSLQGRAATETVKSLAAIIDKLRAVNPKMKIFMAQIIPIANPAQNLIATQLNALMPALVQQKNTPASPVVLVNQADGFVVAKDTTDGIHPTVNADVKIATKWLNALTSQGVCSAKPLLMNALLYKPFNASASSPAGTPDQAFDGDVRNGGWVSYTADPAPQSLDIDMGALFALQYFELSHASVSPAVADNYNTRAYHIEVSQDRAHWSTVATVANNTVGQRTHTVAPVAARYVRLVIDNPNASGLGYNHVVIREFRAMGAPLEAR